MADRPEATSKADTYHRHEADPSKWDEAEAKTGRPNDTPVRDPEPAPLGGNSTLASRAKANRRTSAKQVDADDTEDKSVSRASTKSKK